jgi:hypothetical protein
MTSGKHLPLRPLLPANDLLACGLSTISVLAARMECDRADRTGLKPAGDAISLFGRNIAGAAVYQYSVLVIHIVHIGSSFSEPSAADIQQQRNQCYPFRLVTWVPAGE